MGRFKVNPNWADEMRKKIINKTFVSQVFSYNPGAQFTVACAAENNFPVVLTNLGAGVKRITVADKVCPHCGGRGYLK